MAGGGPGRSVAGSAPFDRQRLVAARLPGPRPRRRPPPGRPGRAGHRGHAGLLGVRCVERAVRVPLRPAVPRLLRRRHGQHRRGPGLQRPVRGSRRHRLRRPLPKLSWARPASLGLASGRPS